MEITKKQWTIIGVVIALIAIWYFFLRKKPTESGYSIGRGYVPDDQNLLLYRGRPLVGSESGFTKVATAGTPVNVKYPTCKRSCSRCTPDNAPCIGAGGYLVD